MFRFFAFTCVFTSLAACSLAQDSWPEYRGPQRNGHVASKKLPLTWSEKKNVVWKTPVHGRAWSTPVVEGSQVWVTTATPDGRKLSVLCLDRKTGKVLGKPPEWRWLGF